MSNVPGAQTALYVCGTRMLSYFPVSIPTHGVALNITVQSYNGSLEYGLIACRRAVPDIDDLADFVVQEHRKLLDAAMKLPAIEGATAPPKLDAKSRAHAADAIAAVAAKKTRAKKAVKRVAKKAVTPAPRKPRASASAAR